ncbi:polysaccharide pyruvyl transferase family protein [Roseobacter weihaiensis]|uniref:polysaccharide pyruvyl transferase family protein n=1 Tax=Roseobacter weihaiensis TaxID=2763262 RepID=UPI001D0B10BC|nr:polysaccharide pyruvyl transferase family protein [Roseobacter sp. H9]
MRIIVENCVFMNGGDSAIGIALRDIVMDTFPEAELTFADSGFPDIARYYPDIDFIPLPSFVMDESAVVRLAARAFGKYRKYLFFRKLYMSTSVAATRLLTAAGLPLPTPVMRAIRPYLDADLVLTTGGTYLLSKYDYGRRLLEFHKSYQLGKPIAAFTQSFEAFSDDFRSRDLAPLLARMELILVRHETSKDHVHALIGRSDHIVTVADSVFALWTPGPTSLADRRARSGRPAEDRLRIAIAVRKLKAYGSRDPETGAALFKQSVLAAITALVREKDADITFLSTCQGIPEYWTDDSAIAVDFAADLPPDVAPHVTVNRAFHTPQDLIEVLQTFDGVIACRLHMAILSICANTPVLPVSYEPKFEETFEELGVLDLVTPIGEIEPEPFAARVLEWTGTLDSVAASLEQAAPRLQASARSAGPALRDALAQKGIC